MAHQITLLEHLQVGPPFLPVVAGPLGTTESSKYSAADIRGILSWDEFCLSAVQQSYGTLLHQAMINYSDMPQTPAKPVRSEVGLRHLFSTYLHKRIERALETGFRHLQATSTMPANTTPVSLGEPYAARTIPGNFSPDAAIYELAVVYGTGPNRAPGEMKPSYKWASEMSGGTQREEQQFFQALSQLNYYMKQHSSRYGFMLTNCEFVAVKRGSTRGVLHLADPVDWTASGTVTSPQMTVALGIWYLGMLASDDLSWSM